MHGTQPITAPWLLKISAYGVWIAPIPTIPHHLLTHQYGGENCQIILPDPVLLWIFFHSFSDWFLVKIRNAAEHFSHLLITLCIMKQPQYFRFLCHTEVRCISPKRKLWILAATCSILESYIRCINTPATLNSTTENDKYNKNVKFWAISRRVIAAVTSADIGKTSLCFILLSIDSVLWI